MKEGPCADIWGKVFEEEGIASAEALGNSGPASLRTTAAGWKITSVGG